MGIVSGHNGKIFVGGQTIDIERYRPSFKINHADWLDTEGEIWVTCRKCNGSGEVEIGKPGDFFRYDYCPRCKGRCSVKLRREDLLREAANALQVSMERITEGIYRVVQSIGPAFQDSIERLQAAFANLSTGLDSPPKKN